MTTIPQEAIDHLTPIVNRLSHDIILDKDEGDWETIVYFAKTIGRKPARYRLAQIAVEMRKEEPNWRRISKQLNAVEEQEEIPVPSSLDKYTELQQDAAEMMLIDRKDDAELNRFLTRMGVRYFDDEEETFDTLDSLVEAYKKGTEKSILDGKPFARDYIVTKFGMWLKRSLAKLGPTTTPLALKKRKRDVNESRAQVNALRQSRVQLRNGGKDPLEEICQVAKQANGSLKLYTKKKSATQIQFGNSQEEDDSINDSEEEGAHGTHQLSEVPEMMKYRSAKKSTNSAPQDSPGSGRRKRWTQEQKTAFKAALKDYGKGCWKEMIESDQYRQYWIGKSNVHLKDLYRTMKKRGEIQSDDEAAKMGETTDDEGNNNKDGNNEEDSDV